MDAVMFGLAKPMFGAPADYADRSRLAAAAQVQHRSRQGEEAPRRGRLSSDIDVPISFDLGFAGVNEPICVLVQESLAQIGIQTTINKVPGANWRTELTKKTMPLFTNVFSGWLDYPEYFFYLVLPLGQNSIFNTMRLPVAGDGRLHRRRPRRGGERRHRRPTTRT